MNFISQAFFATVITSLTGTIGLGFWAVCRNWFLKWNPNLVYQALRMVCILYVMPFGYIIVQLTVRDGYIQTDDIWQLNFSVAGLMESAFFIAGIIWAALTFRSLVKCLVRNVKWYSLCRRNLPMEDGIQEEFHRVCRKLKIRRKIRLYQNSLVSSPMMVGVFRCSVLLPPRKYTKEQLTVIFFHELTHYKNHDLWYKSCSVWIRVIQHVNICADRLLLLLNEWSEYYCDAGAVEAMGDEMTPKRYFEIIIELMANVPETVNEDYIFSMLCESQHCLERRIEFMGKYRKIAKKAGMAAFVTVFMLSLVSVSTAYAAGNGMSVLYDELYQNAEDVEVAAAESQGEIFIPAADDTDYELVYANPEAEEIMPLLDANENVSFSWSVTPNTRHVSSKFYVKSGQTIVTSCSITPGGQTCWLGIMDPHNNVRCVEGTNSLSHSFTVTESGNYRVFVQNKGTKDITGNGNYYYY